MRTRLTMVAFAVVLLASCESLLLGTKYVYTYALTKPAGANRLEWADDTIDIAFAIYDKEVDFQLRNNASHTIKVNWDETVLILFGEAKKTIHSGVKYVDRNASQPGTVIPAGTSIKDMVLPSDNVYYREGYYGTYYSSPGGWEEKDLFATNDLNKDDYKQTILGSKGQTLGLHLALQIDGQDVAYDFEFTITDVQPVVKPAT